MKRFILVGLALAACTSDPEFARWRAQADNVTITRDDWGIAHVKGRSDADAVFGMIYAQAEDDFNRVETNFINSQGRLAEAEGESAIWRDLRMKLFINPDSMKAMYERSPDWLKSLMNAWADGLNYYLHTHPEVTPRVITRFEPWMALTFSEGSIGGDIESINLTQLEAFYGQRPAQTASADTATADVEPRGSNGVAIAPSNTTNGRALLLINPHTSFFFRSELQMTSDSGLNAYGAATWGQFFIYQGFNDHAGWMHTSSGVDNIDEFLVTVEQRGDGYVYKHGAEVRPVVASRVDVPFRTDTGMATRTFTVYRTHHGPIVRAVDGRWVAVQLMNEPLKALQQSYLRTKATDYDSYRKSMEFYTNSSNNTIYADSKGNIAYFHSNFVPRRDPKLDWTRPVDGSDPATDWQGIHTLDESPDLHNPATGWLYNANNWPWSAAGSASRKRADFAAYFEEGNAETPRGYHALRVFENRKDFTLDGLVTAAYDSYLTAFDKLLPPLLRAWERAPAADKAKLAEPVAQLRGWDRRWSAESIPTTVAVFWGEEVSRRVAADARRANLSADDYIAARAAPAELIGALSAAVDTLTSHFGKWETPWGDINRFQRLTSDIVQKFDDAAPSIPVPFTSARWGSLASFGARAYPGTKKWYGTSGNSFVAVVEFGDSVRARAVTAGGLNSDPASPHFNDQAERYAAGNLRDVYFYPAQIEAHARRVYKPGR
jgi:acyl-homoserine lactone acylase PvdQ